MGPPSGRATAEEQAPAIIDRDGIFEVFKRMLLNEGLVKAFDYVIGAKLQSRTPDPPPVACESAVYADLAASTRAAKPGPSAAPIEVPWATVVSRHARKNQPTLSGGKPPVTTGASAKPPKTTPSATKAPKQAPAVPAVPRRATREVLLACPAASSPVTLSSAATVVTSINSVTGRQSALALRRLPSGDTAVVFSSPDEATWHRANPYWTTQVHAQAHIKQRLYTVKLKGLPRASADGLLRAGPAVLGPAAVALKTTGRPETPTTAVLVQLTEIEAANKLIDDGFLFDHQLFYTERYADRRPTQCFRCFQFGHRARVCRLPQRCGNCPALRHAPGTTCPGSKCLGCKGSHPAWDRRCPAWILQAEQAAAACIDRPRRFDPPNSDSRAPAATLPATADAFAPGFHTVAPPAAHADEDVAMPDANPEKSTALTIIPASSVNPPKATSTRKRRRQQSPSPCPGSPIPDWAAEAIAAETMAAEAATSGAASKTPTSTRSC